MLDQHKTTCYHCGEDTGKPAVVNQYPLCDVGIGKGWKNKAFTIIAKRSRGKKAKVANINEAEVEGEAMEGEIDNEIVEFSNIEGFQDDIIIEEKEDDNGVDDECDDDEDEAGVESDLVSGSKKRNKESKKTRGGFISNADDEFIHMHGRGDFSSLPCNDFSNVAFLLREDNKGRNLSAKKSI